MQFIIIFMKYYFILLLLLFNKLYAQDLIVLENGDSLNCMISMVDNKYIYFAYTDENGNLLNSAIQKDKIIDFKREFYGKVQPTTPYQIKTVPNAFFKKPLAILSFYGGLSYLTAKIPSNSDFEIEKYYKNLKWGTHYGLNIGIHINEKIGIGFKHTVFTTTNSIDVYVVDTAGNFKFGDLRDDIKTKFYGPTFFVTSNSINGKWVLNAAVSIGYIDYVNHFTLIDHYLLTGNTVGFYYDLDFIVRLDNNIALGLRMALMTGYLDQMTVDDGTHIETINFDNGEGEELSRLEFSFGLKWYINKN